MEPQRDQTQNLCYCQREPRNAEVLVLSGTGMPVGSSPVWGLAVAGLVMAAIVAALVWFDVHEQVLRLLQWLDMQGLWAPVLFTLIMAAVVVLVLPGILFTTGAGFVFGVIEGTLFVVVGTTVGAALAFLIARHLFGARTAHYILSNPRLRVVSEELTPQGWKIVLLTRLVPFFPFKLSNYFFGLTRFSLRDFVLGTCIGIIPLSLHNVYLGSIAADIATLGARHPQRTTFEWLLYGAGFVAALVVLVYINRLAQRALARHGLKRHNGGDQCRG